MPEAKIKVSCNSCGLITGILPVDPLPACDECGGTLAVFAARTSGEPTTQECAQCGEANPPDARFCESCGAAVGEEAPPPRTKKGPSKIARRRAELELGEAMRSMKQVRIFFIGLACLNTALFLLLVHGYAVISSAAGPEADMSFGILLLAISGCTMLICILGAAFIQRGPFAWSLGLSCLMTLTAVLQVIARELPIMGSSSPCCAGPPPPSSPT